MATDWTQTTRLLKAVVIVLGVRIVLGMTILAVEIFRRAGSGGDSGGLATATVPLPAGSRVLGMSGEGDALSLLVEGPDGAQRVVTVDRRTGAVLGTLTLAPAR